MSDNAVLARMNFTAANRKDRPASTTIPIEGAPCVAAFAERADEDKPMGTAVCVVLSFPAPRFPLIIVPLRVAEVPFNAAPDSLGVEDAEYIRDLVDARFSAALLKVHTDSAGQPVSAVAVVTRVSGDRTYVTPTYYAVGVRDALSVEYTGPDFAEAHDVAKKFFHKL